MLTAKRAREVLDYDKISGFFTWKYPINNRIKVGDIAGYVTQGYWRISVDGTTYLGHRLAWLHVTGEWPKVHIDHDDTNRSNNAFKNLREATVSQNHFNIGLTASNTSGFKGVSWFKQRRKLRARITVNKILLLGRRRVARRVRQLRNLTNPLRAIPDRRGAETMRSA